MILARDDPSNLDSDCLNSHLVYLGDLGVLACWGLVDAI